MLPLTTAMAWAWLQAFCVTQCVETPLYACGLAAVDKRWSRRLLWGFGASAITHPIVWFGMPWRIYSYGTVYIVAECFAVSVEALYLWLLGVRPWRAWAASLLINGASVAVGECLRRFAGW